MLFLLPNSENRISQGLPPGDSPGLVALLPRCVRWPHPDTSCFRPAHTDCLTVSVGPESRGRSAGSSGPRPPKAAVLFGLGRRRLCSQDHPGGCWQDAGPRGPLAWCPGSSRAVSQLAVGPAVLGSWPRRLPMRSSHPGGGFIGTSNRGSARRRPAFYHFLLAVTCSGFRWRSAPQKPVPRSGLTPGRGPCGYDQQERGSRDLSGEQLPQLGLLTWPEPHPVLDSRGASPASPCRGVPQALPGRLREHANPDPRVPRSQQIWSLIHGENVRCQMRLSSVSHSEFSSRQPRPAPF